MVPVLELPLVTRNTRDDVCDFEPQAKVLALLRVLTERESSPVVSWPELRRCVLSVPREESLLSLRGTDEIFKDVEPLLKTILINLHGQGFIKIAPDGIWLLVTDADMSNWNNHFEDRCSAARNMLSSKGD
jgi:hypothetical protein